MTDLLCRCGFDGTGDHPCHGEAYTCRKPAKARYYVPTMRFALAGAQMKVSASQTFSCDECWKKFQDMTVDLTALQNTK